MIYFVTGIDTEIGKSVATGILARWFRQQGRKSITYKLVQTGCSASSEDIALHRRLMGISLLPEDVAGGTSGPVFPFAGSPHLAAELSGERVDAEQIVDAINRLAADYDPVLVEGAGGLMVPLTRELSTIDLVSQQRWPVVLVTAPRLGSINHTLLSLAALATRGITLAAVIYNLHFTAAPEIVADTRRVIQAELVRQFGAVPLVDLPADVLAQAPNQWNPTHLEL